MNDPATTRLAREKELTRAQRRRAVRQVAAGATDAEDCARILAALGLDAAEGKYGPVSEVGA